MRSSNLIAFDPPLFGAVGLVVAVCVVVATGLPTLRAVRTDVVSALRRE